MKNDNIVKQASRGVKHATKRGLKATGRIVSAPVRVPYQKTKAAVISGKHKIANAADFVGDKKRNLQKRVKHIKSGLKEFSAQEHKVKYLGSKALKSTTNKIKSTGVYGRAVNAKNQINDLRKNVKEAGGLKKYTASAVKDRAALAKKSIANKVKSTAPVQAFYKGKNIAKKAKKAAQNTKAFAKKMSPKNIAARNKARREKFKRDRAKNGGGLKGTAKTLRDRAKNKIKNNKFLQRKFGKNSQLAQTITKVTKFLAVAGKTVGIGTVIMIALVNMAIFAVSATSRFSSTPHYYCELEASDLIKHTELYQRYCGTTSTGMGIDENGAFMGPYWNQCHGMYNPTENPDQVVWEYTDYPGMTINGVGPAVYYTCGFCSTSTALSWAKGELIKPHEDIPPHLLSKSGSAYAIRTEPGQVHEVEVTLTNSIYEVVDALKEGNAVVCHVPNHFICLIGYLNDGTIAVADPSQSAFSAYWLNGKQGHSPEAIDAKASAATTGEKYVIYHTARDIDRTSYTKKEETTVEEIKNDVIMQVHSER